VESLPSLFSSYFNNNYVKINTGESLFVVASFPFNLLITSHIYSSTAEEVLFIVKEEVPNPETIFVSPSNNSSLVSLSF